MIVVRIELHSAVTGEISEIGRMYIANDGTGSRRRGNYDALVMRRGAASPPTWAEKVARAVRRSRVENYPRISLPIWELVRRALDAAFGANPIHSGTSTEFDADVKGEVF